MKIYTRCSCCNGTPDLEIVLYPEDYKPRVIFYKDRRDPTKIICSDCFESVHQTLVEYGDKDGKESN